MNHVFFRQTRQIMKGLIITLQPFWILGVLLLVLQYDWIGILFDIVLIIVIIQVILLSYFIREAVLRVPKRYLHSSYFQAFQKPYKTLTAQEKYTYYISSLFEVTLHVAIEYDPDETDHLFFTYQDKAYSILCKDYQGTITKSGDRLWELSYKEHAFKDIKTMNILNPFHENKRIIERNYQSRYKTIQPIIILSKETLTKESIDGTYRVFPFINELRGFDYE